AMATMLRDDWANPSSVHRAGQNVRHRIDLAREAVGDLVGCRDRELVFTSGGTEAINLAIRGSLTVAPERRLVVSSRLEHSAVRGTLDRLVERGEIKVHWIGADLAGRLDLDELDDVLDAHAEEIALVTLLWANNETGVVQPIERIGAACHARGVRFHVDAVQCVGKRPVTVRDLPIDLMSISAHKLHGPKGVGALYLRRGVRVEPLITGGPQERERRGGTENAPGIVGFGVAATEAKAWLATSDVDRVGPLRDEFERRIVEALPDTSVNGGDAERLWNTTNLGFPRLEAEAILLSLSERGVSASAGAACSSGSLDPSPVLLAMGIDPRVAHGSIRFSLSRETTHADIDGAVPLVIDVVSRLKALRPP
ncbi:MAG: aminotransferase class V-fold PLP-dependent enzyme, partial [Phycisphaerales bacterium]|nr:aminotransferase class V-fold PLP-dependent enzyme [Phycisphaerales bacterium]